jgi:hypothetical protein
VLALSCTCTFAAHASDTERTTLVIKNATSQPVPVGVILAALGGACPANHPPVTADQLAAKGFCSQVTESGNPPYAGKCLLTLKANSSIRFPDIPKTCISGNVTFGGYAACPNAAFPMGTTTAEFTLNPSFGAEAVDISLVNGYSGVVSISMKGGGGWNDGTSPISTIQNKPLGQNVGNPGVYPKDCTLCVGLGGTPVCPGFSTKPVCQNTNICNVQRNTSGGTVTIVLQP